MAHRDPHFEIAVPWPLAGRTLDSLGQVGTAVVHQVLRWSEMLNGMPELRMSREWLAEHERRSNSRYDGS